MRGSNLDDLLSIRELPCVGIVTPDSGGRGRCRRHSRIVRGGMREGMREGSHSQEGWMTSLEPDETTPDSQGQLR